MRAFEAIKIGSDLLKKKNIQTHILDSELLLSKTLDKSREEILVKLDQNINRGKFLIFKEYLQRRCHNEPIAYITGEKEFWNEKFKVNKDTLIHIKAVMYTYKYNSDIISSLLDGSFPSCTCTLINLGVPII